ncbi:hypothetical protein [Streptomyces sp. CC219B]|uniref:hypothetical protein n=1 Tax=Streptomyces sp. CC219B TaxID=3044574 RepID=UPI0024A7D4CA|nr:hypothetical protein [Streptomyces sp. CC219B]
MTAGWCTRTIRAAVFAAVCVLLAALGHVLMSGSHVPGRTLLAGAAVTGGVGWALAGRERGLPLILAVVVAAQTGLHAGFSSAQSQGRPAGDMGPAPHLHAGHAMPVDVMDMGHAHAHMESASDGSSSFGMLAAHLLAALLTGLWLAHGERAAFRILRAVAGWLAAPLRLSLARLVVPPRRPRIRARRRRSERAPRLLLVHAITSRGPPMGPAVA